MMNAFRGLLEWLGDPAHWSGTEGVPARLVEHMEISLAAVGVAIVFALPIGLVIGHTRRAEFIAVSVANLGRAIPSFAILSIVFQLMLNVAPRLSFGFLPTAIALTLLAIPPILTNTYVGIQAVDADAVEAARGMGMHERQVLGRLELPLAAPLVLAGVRTAAVQVVATATLAALIGGGGLGRYIIDGFAQNDLPMVLAGAVLVAGLAVLTELVFGLIERLVTPRTSTPATRLPGPRLPVEIRPVT
jgi:osmoprotectant transport system permease protein